MRMHSFIINNIYIYKTPLHCIYSFLCYIKFCRKRRKKAKTTGLSPNPHSLSLSLQPRLHPCDAPSFPCDEATRHHYLSQNPPRTKLTAPSKKEQGQHPEYGSRQ